MPRAPTGPANRTLARISLGLVGIILGLQVVIFGLWGDDGDPPDSVVVGAFVPFWGSIVGLVVVVVVAVRRRLGPARSSS